VETHTEATSPQVGNIDVTNKMDNKDGTVEHNPEDPKYYDDSMASSKSFNETGCANTSSGQQLFQIWASKVENQEECLTKLFTDRVDNKNEGHENMITITTNNQEKSLTEISASTASSKILSRGIHNQIPNIEDHLKSWQTQICANTANIKERYTPPQHYRRYLYNVSLN
jgi:uncharacterized coiled-coil protein SlyX